MASTVHSFTLTGIHGHLVEVETDTLIGLPSVSIVGLGDKAVKEAKERLEAAIKNAGYQFPPQKIVFNLAPSDMKKTGTHFDLPMAIGLLIKTNQIKPHNFAQTGIIGELSLNSHIRPVSGILPMVIKAKELGLTKLIVAIENMPEAQLVKGVNIIGCKTLKEAIFVVEGKHQPVIETEAKAENLPEDENYSVDFKDVKGLQSLIEYIGIAAAGGHNFLMIGPPGCGKSMIAKRIPTILPKMIEEESLEVMKIYSVANLLKDKGSLITDRPFRFPHHNASINSLIGGGPFAMPGEISLAHHGVLFLDEMAEFGKKSLDALRQPLEDHSVTISRVWGTNTYPANFMLVGAMNPCPCGYHGQHQCRCTDYEVIKYRQRLSGPIMDRMDIQKFVGVVDFFNKEEEGASSSEIRQKVERARAIQQERYKNIAGVNCNAQLTPALIKKFCVLDRNSLDLLQQAYLRFRYSGRSLDKFIKVARTIADLEGKEQIEVQHMKKSLLSRDVEKDSLLLTGG
ncbi:YifB family Mg chelatase-like AAA ATPase [Cytobacillus depressus]|uniref:YifB family Mg chelatase-like AAA ATPase n=1 Tax=Cytobacillus depressus TaxID=1602942 RepID=A0A6L3V836_9BACI|nr:YifB family Mg chelatase-like AAA ATPase [Cytobacillus depressus]KAB2336767.1 YifB family Mg chelatase-like AAA ATPase [Cytobacillus depressus]